MVWSINQTFEDAHIHLVLPHELLGWGNSAWAPYKPLAEEVIGASENATLDYELAWKLAEESTCYTDHLFLEDICVKVQKLLDPELPLVLALGFFFLLYTWGSFLNACLFLAGQSGSEISIYVCHGLKKRTHVE